MSEREEGCVPLPEDTNMYKALFAYLHVFLCWVIYLHVWDREALFTVQRADGYPPPHTHTNLPQ